MAIRGLPPGRATGICTAREEDFHSGERMEVPLWHSRLRIQHCCSCGIGRNCNVGSIPGPGKFCLPLVCPKGKNIYGGGRKLGGLCKQRVQDFPLAEPLLGKKRTLFFLLGSAIFSGSLLVFYLIEVSTCSFLQCIGHFLKKKKTGVPIMAQRKRI